MKLRFFDFEVFPHWWCCTFGDYVDTILQVTEDMKDSFTVITSDTIGARDLLVSKFKEDGVCVSGYNIKHYDLIIANAIYQGFKPEQIKIINDIIINPDCKYSTKEHIRLAPFANKKLPVNAYQELMDDSRSGSLKDNEAVLGLDIRESEVPFDKEDLTESDKNSILYYNAHDVFASMYFYHNVTKAYVQGKLLLGKVFNIPENVCYKNTNANLTGMVLKAKYTSFADEFRCDVELPSNIRSYVYDSLPSKLIESILNNPYIINGSSVSVKSIETTLFENTITFGNGGLHSVLRNCLYVESNEDYALMNVDVASFYPSLLVLFNCLSRAVTDPDKYKWIFHERLRLKFKGSLTQDEKDTVAVFKLILNTVFGASGNKYLALYDKYMCLKTCRLGQVILASLANKLYKNVQGLKIIQTNTDGILIYVKRKLLDTVKNICHDFEQMTGMMLEYDECHKIWQRDVNNYMLVEYGWDGDYRYDLPPRMNKNLKLCGEWLQYTWHRYPFPDVGVQQAFVSSKAAIQYLINKDNIVKTIVSNHNIDDYIIFCKKGPTFRYVVHRMADGTEIPLNRANRVIATTNTKFGKLYKVKFRKGVQSYNAMPDTPDNCMLVNEAIDDNSFAKYKSNINYMYYIERAHDLLNIKWVDINGDRIYDFDLE